jgi:hypothetical protein
MSFIRSADRYSSLGRQALTDDQLHRLVPSAFATTAHDSRSDRFALIPTSGIITALRREGFEPFSAKQAATRDASKRDFTKHMIRFRRTDTPTTGQGLAIGNTFPEVVLVNANDGSSSYRLMAGLFRLVCLNGMVVSDGHRREVRINHMGDVRRQVIEGSYEVLDESRRSITAAAEWARVPLTRDEQMVMAEAAHLVRFADPDGTINTPIQAGQLLTTRRQADAGGDLWSTFNRVQENVIRGGLSAFARDERGRRLRRVTTKEVQGIDGDVRLNRALWAIGERMAQLRGAA